MHSAKDIFIELIYTGNSMLNTIYKVIKMDGRTVQCIYFYTMNLTTWEGKS